MAPQRVLLAFQGEDGGALEASPTREGGVNVRGGRWCRQCGEYRSLGGFDKVGDKLRRFCSPECRDEYEKQRAAKKTKKQFPTFK